MDNAKLWKEPATPVGLSIEDPQWLSYCVDDQCSFQKQGSQCYTCVRHNSKHTCNGITCKTVMEMSNRRKLNLDSSECHIAKLSAFRQVDVEYRDHFYNPGKHSCDRGYESIVCDFGERRGVPKRTSNYELLKSCVPALIALYSTIFSKDFLAVYVAVHKQQTLRDQGSGVVNTTSWTRQILKLTTDFDGKTMNLPCEASLCDVVKEAVYKTVMAVITLFGQCDKDVKKFTNKLVCKHKKTKRREFYTMIVILALCFFPYLNVNTQTLLPCNDNKTLVRMCFDKKLSKHNQWSKLSIMIHLHVKNKKFTHTLSKPLVYNRVPAIVHATVEKFMSEASYRENCDNPVLGTPTTANSRTRQPDIRRDPLHARKRELGKRKDLAECAFTEYHEARFGGKKSKL